MLLSSWNRGDATNFIHIAQFGYQRPSDSVFFPLFPFLISMMAHVLGSWSYLLVSTLLSNGAFLGAIFVIYLLVVDCAGEKVGQRTLIYLCIFPTAFYFFAAYSESLLLLLTSATFLALRCQRWWLAGTLGLLAALTHPVGILLFIPFIYEIYQSQSWIVTARKHTLFKMLPILLIPTGTAIYCLYLWYTMGNPIEFFSVLSWNFSFNFFSEFQIVDLSATIGFVILAVLGWYKIRTSWSIWFIMLLLYVLLRPGLGKVELLEANQCFVLEMFPGFIILAMLSIKHSRLQQMLLLIFPVVLATLSILFFTGLWIT